MKNTFNGTVKSFHNEDIHALIAKFMSFRIQLIVRPERKSLSGWTDSLTVFIENELDRLTDQLEASTIKKSTTDIETLKNTAADTTGTIADSYDDNTFAADEILGDTGVEQEIQWNFDGTDKNIPQPTDVEFPNPEFRAFVKKVDYTVRALSRLTSRHNPSMIESYDSAVIRTQFLEKLYSANQRYGSSANRSPVPAGVLPSDEEATFSGPDAV